MINLSNIQTDILNILILNKGESFTPDRLYNLTGYGIRRIKYNLTLLKNRDIGIEEESVCIQSTGYCYSNGYYYNGKDDNIKTYKELLKPQKITHKELVNKTGKWLKRHDQNIRVPNCSLIAEDLVSLNITGEVPDVIGWNGWTSILIEVKVSRGDFLRDKKKLFRIIPENGMGEFRYYCCPDDLIKENELPDNWGLLYVNEKKKINIIKVAEKQESNLVTERSMLLSIIRRMK